jgi:hypothetical protein
VETRIPRMVPTQETEPTSSIAGGGFVANMSDYQLLKMNGNLTNNFSIRTKPGQRSRYSDWLRAGRLRGRSSSPDKVKNFSLPQIVQTGSRVHPTSYPKGTRSLSQGVKRPGREADHSPPASAEVKNMWIYTSTSTPRYTMA